MNNSEYKIYLKNKKKHLKKIKGLSKKDAKYYNKLHYVPIIKKQLLAKKKSNGIYELDDWHIYPTSGFCMSKRNVSQRLDIDKFIETYLDPNACPFIEEELEEKSYFKRRDRGLGDTYKWIYCCKCKEEVKAVETVIKGKCYYKCNCGLKVETDNNDDFPQPLGNICNQELKKGKKEINKLIDKFCKNNEQKMVKLFKFTTEKLKLKSQIHIGEIKTIQGAKVVYTVIKDYINTGLTNVERIV